MKFLKLLTVLSLIVSTTAFADLERKLKRNWKESTGTSKLYGGGANTAFNIGVSHERRKGSLGIDGLLLLSGENDSDDAGAKDAQILIGTSLVHHLVDNSNADVYLGTGFAAIQHQETSATDDDETTFGALFRIGSSYYVNEDWSIGLEYLTALNWSSDDLPAEHSFGFITLGYTY